MNLSQVQNEHREWLRKNFPNQGPIMPAAGMVEEAGELVHALLKCQQSSVWGPEPRYRSSNWSIIFTDAIGDCAIYAISLCNTLQWDFLDACVEARLATLPPMTAFDATASLVRAGCDVVEMQMWNRLVLYIAHLMHIANTWNIDFQRAVVVTWAIVKERNRENRVDPVLQSTKQVEQ